MRAVWGLIFMALSVKVAKTDPMPLKLQVEVLSKENPKVFKKRPIHILVPSGRLKGYVFVYKQDYGTSDLVPGYGPASRDRGPWDGPCEPKGASCGKRRGKGKCCRGLLCYGHRTQKDTLHDAGHNYRCVLADRAHPPLCLKRNRRCRYAGTRDACCMGTTCRFVKPSQRGAKKCI